MQANPKMISKKDVVLPNDSGCAKVNPFPTNVDAMLNISHGNPPHHPFFGKRRHGPSFKYLDIPRAALRTDVVKVT